MKTNFETLVDIAIRAEKEGSPRHELILGIGPTPERLVGLGFQDLRLVVKAKTIGKMFFEHGLTQGLIEKIPAILEAPKAIWLELRGFKCKPVQQRMKNPVPGRGAKSILPSPGTSPPDTRAGEQQLARGCLHCSDST